MLTGDNQNMDKKQFKNIDEYIAGFPEDIQAILQNLRRVIHEAAPEAEEPSVTACRLSN